MPPGMAPSCCFGIVYENILMHGPDMALDAKEPPPKWRFFPECSTDPLRAAIGGREGVAVPAGITISKES